MAELKDLIPSGNDNDSNSNDSWFVLSSASEEEDEDDEPEVEKQELAQVENLCKEENKKKKDAPELEDSKSQQIENSHSDINQAKENGPLDEITRVEQSENIPKDTTENTEQSHTIKLDIEVSQKEAAVTVVNEKKSEIPIELEKIQEKPEMNEKKSEIPIELEKIQEKPELGEEKKQEKELDKEIKQKELYKEIKQSENEKESLNHGDTVGKEDKRLQEEAVVTEIKQLVVQEVKKPTMAKQRQKAKPLITDEGSHSEIALEVHALRETLIQLSLNLSNMEQEKYNSIVSEVQGLRETVTQLNNDLSNRVNQIETRTEQVHTLLCRFIMNRCSSYKEPPTQVITMDKEHRPASSDAAVQTEMSEIKLPAVSKISETSAVLKSDSAATNKLLHINKTDNGEKKSQTTKHKSPLLPTPSKEQLESCGLKRPRLDYKASEISKEFSHNNGISGKVRSSSSNSSKQQEFSLSHKEKAHHDQNKPKHSRVEPSRNFKEPFHQYSTACQSHNSNQEVELLGHRSSEGSKCQTRKRPNHSQQGGDDRKYPYSEQTLEGQDLSASKTELGISSNRFPDELDMDKVIDEWAQDED